MIKSILGFGYLVFAMIFLLPFASLALIFYALGFKKSMKVVVYRLAQAWALSLIPVAGCKTTVTGKEKIPRKGGICFVSNHSGYFDIIMMLAYAGRPFGFIAKKEFLYMPFLNIWIFMLGGHFIDRKNARKAIRTINIGIQQIKAGGGMVIFPEGTRSRNADVLPFHVGSLKLATQADAVIVPVAIGGSYKVYERQKLVVGADVNISFMDPIDTSILKPEERKQVLCDRIYSVIKEEVNRLNEA
ncbi:MAG: 1-acyl-sn-glycerol-3-phosphate acyltransferase [Treponema sp.]|nr:1-acyl-sn-glycerol-3-phosphate acyltransferase [Treponema sp.]